MSLTGERQGTATPKVVQRHTTPQLSYRNAPHFFAGVSAADAKTRRRNHPTPPMQCHAFGTGQRVAMGYKGTTKSSSSCTRVVLSPSLSTTESQLTEDGRSCSVLPTASAVAPPSVLCVKHASTGSIRAIADTRWVCGVCTLLREAFRESRCPFRGEYYAQTCTAGSPR